MRASTRDYSLKKRDNLKKEIIKLMFGYADTFFLQCMPDPKFYLGMRGLQGDEQKYGIILVFGAKSYRNLNLTDEGISCQLQFQKWEVIFIPYRTISRIFDKGGEMMMQWSITTRTDRKTIETQIGKLLGPEKQKKSLRQTPREDFLKKTAGKISNLIKVDFRKRKIERC